jgi:hypothetical protein
LELSLNPLPSALCSEAGELGYPNAAEAKELTVPEIPAQSASDTSYVAIKASSASGRSSLALFSGSSVGRFQSSVV